MSVKLCRDSDHDCVNPNCASPIGTMCENADKCHGYVARKDYLQRLSGEKESGAGWYSEKQKSDGMRSYAGVARKLEPTAENLALVLRLYGTISGESAEILGHNTAKMAEVFTSTIETRDYYKSAYEQQREIITGCIKQIRALTSENARLRTKSVDIESAKMLMHDKDVCIAALMAGNDDQREKLRQAEAIIRKATERAEKAEAVINRCRRNKAARYRLCVKRFSQHGAATAAGEGTKQC